jgi:ABC-type Fe3+-hydroxamate transport system substrate-binding protein
LEIIRKDMPPPPLFIVKIYENDITVWNVTIKSKEESTVISEVSNKAKEFLKRTGSRHSTGIRVFDSLSDEKVNSMKNLLEEAGLKNINVRRID